MVIQLLGVIAGVAMLVVSSSGCVADSMPTIQGTVRNVVVVQVCDMDVTLFVLEPIIFGYESYTYALVPSVELAKGDRLAVYTRSGLSVLSNGDELAIPRVTRFYRLGATGIDLVIGWNYPRVLPSLERQLGCGDSSGEQE